MPLESIKLTNFQRHESLRIDLDPAVTVLTGSSDSGKSSVLRALRWLCTGQAPRSPMARWGSKEVSVRVTVDGRKVERSKGKENIYRLDGKKFAAVGQGNVPAEVAGVLNVGEQNFAGQHDAHFWLADTPGEVSRQLNGIVNLDLIDASLARAAAAVREAKAREVLSKERLEQAEQRAAELAWVEEADGALQKLELLDGLIVDKTQQAQEIAQATEDARNAERAAGSGHAAANAKQRAMERLQGIADRHADASNSYELLFSMVKEVRRCEQEARTAAARATETAKRMGKVCPTCLRPIRS